MKTIEIKCEGAATLSIEGLKEFQGKLKSLSPENKKKLKNNILKYGFSAPIFVWKKGEEKYILDGKQWLIVLSEMQKAGYVIPDLPVAYIQAASWKEAKKKLLAITSQFGKIEKAGLEDFLLDADILEEDIIDEVDFTGIVFDNNPKSQEQEETLRPYKKTHFLISFNPGLYPKIQKNLEKILELEGVEYEQSSN